ncbi:unnamed protein product, partial [Meganyctiphanes norvegica]
MPEGGGDGSSPLTPIPPQQPLGEPDPKMDKSSLHFTAFNYINSIVGSGVIGMPFALEQAGFGVGLVLLVVVACVTDVSLVLMIKAARISEMNTYQDLVASSFGRIGFYICSALQFMYPFISLVSYNIIVGDTLTKVLVRVTGMSTINVLARREFVMAATTLLITLPLSLYRNISRLAKISLVSVVMITVIAVAMLVRLPTMKDLVPPTDDAWRFVGSNLASAIGVMSFAFMCHHSSFLVFDSLVDNTQERWNKVTHISIGGAAILSLVFAVGGYAAFTGFVQGDIFENYCWADDLMNVCRGLYTVTILLTFPIECFVARDVLETAFFRSYGPQPLLRHAVMTVVIAVLVMFFSLSTDCLGVVLELNGIMCAIPLAYILPPLCFIRLEEGPMFGPNKLVAWGVVAFGSTSFLVGLISLFSNWSTVSECSHGVQMAYCFQDVNGTDVQLLF